MAQVRKLLQHHLLGCFAVACVRTPLKAHIRGVCNLSLKVILLLQLLTREKSIDLREILVWSGELLQGLSIHITLGCGPLDITAQVIIYISRMWLLLLLL